MNNFFFYNRQFSVLHIYLLLLLVILYSQVLSIKLVSGNRVILFVCFFVYILREVKCKFIITCIKIFDKPLLGDSPQ